MKEYERITQKQGEPKIVSKRVYYRLRELEDKIDNGNLISTSDIGDNEIEFFVKHNADVRKETAKDILQCLYDKCYETQNLREDYAHITPLDILILAKQYGVEVEE